MRLELHVLPNWFANLSHPDLFLARTVTARLCRALHAWCLRYVHVTVSCQVAGTSQSDVIV